MDLLQQMEMQTFAMSWGRALYPYHKHNHLPTSNPQESPQKSGVTESQPAEPYRRTEHLSAQPYRHKGLQGNNHVRQLASKHWSLWELRAARRMLPPRLFWLKVTSAFENWSFFSDGFYLRISEAYNFKYFYFYYTWRTPGLVHNKHNHEHTLCIHTSISHLNKATTEQRKWTLWPIKTSSPYDTGSLSNKGINKLMLQNNNKKNLCI